MLRQAAELLNNRALLIEKNMRGGIDILAERPYGPGESPDLPLLAANGITVRIDLALFADGSYSTALDLQPMLPEDHATAVDHAQKMMARGRRDMDDMLAFIKEELGETETEDK
jgi:hypothetical protein